MDGAGRLNIFKVAVWPTIQPTILMLALFVTIWSLRRFDLIWLMTQGGPLGATDTLVIELYREAFVYHDLGTAAAVGMIGMSVALAVTILYFRFSRMIEKARGKTDARRPFSPPTRCDSQASSHSLGSRSSRSIGCWSPHSPLRRNSLRTSRNVLPTLSELSVFREMFAKVPIGTWLTNSFLVAAGTTVLTLVLAVLPAYALSRFHFRGKPPLGLRPLRHPDVARGHASSAALRDLRQACSPQPALGPRARRHCICRPCCHLDPEGRGRRHPDRDRGGRADGRLHRHRHTVLGVTLPLIAPTLAAGGSDRLLPGLERGRLRANADFH